MVTWMHWMLANMAFIIVSNAKNLLMDNPTPDHKAIGQIGGKYFARYKAERTEQQGIEGARDICTNFNGVLATQLDDQQFQFIFETEKLFFSISSVRVLKCEIAQMSENSRLRVLKREC